MTSAVKHRLSGKAVPSVSLSSSDGSYYDLSWMNGTTVLYIYPRTSPPNDAPTGLVPGDDNADEYRTK